MIAVSLCLSWVALGCQPARGGWDLEALVGEYPAIETLPGHRLGDMLPFPSFEGDRVVLLACRFPAGEAIRVTGDGLDWPRAWARSAVTALDRGASGFALSLREPSGRFRGSADPQIRVTSLGPRAEDAPIGLADTLSVCDISRTRGVQGGRARGLLLGSAIRIKRARLDWRHQSLAATAEEWVGALMHEIGHAMGYSGHVATGHSILVRDERQLRRAGRRALAGEAWRDQTLEALYRIRPGQRLGTRPLAPESVLILSEIRELLKRDSVKGSRSVEVRSTVGDWQARVEWLLSDGSRLSVRMMHWRDELRVGGAMTLLPDAATRRVLAGRAR